MQTRKVTVIIFCILLASIPFIPTLLLFFEPEDPWDIKKYFETKLQEKNNPLEPYEEYEKEIDDSFLKQLSEELNLEFLGYGKKPKEWGLYLSTRHPATIQEARALLLLVINKYLHAINTHEKIQPFLQDRPVTNKQVKINIQFTNDRIYHDGLVHGIHKTSDSALDEYKNKLFYHTDDPFTADAIDLLEESFEMAVANNEISPIQNPGIHQATEMEEALDQTFKVFMNDIWKEAQLCCWRIGEKIDNGVDHIGCHFEIICPHSHEEARELVLFASKKLLHEINSNEKLKPYLKEYPFLADRLKMRICFTNERACPYFDGSMEYVILDGNAISYFKTLTEPKRGPNVHMDMYQTDFVAKESYSEAEALMEKVPLTNRKFKF